MGWIYVSDVPGKFLVPNRLMVFRHVRLAALRMLDVPFTYPLDFAYPFVDNAYSKLPATTFAKPEI
jgi:hypothetical protein